MEIYNDIDEHADLAEIFRALAEPLRLQIIRALMNRPMCVSRLAAALGAQQPSMSRALGILRRAGLVKRQRCGTFVRYAIADAVKGASLAPLCDFIASAMPEVYDHEAADRALAAQGIKPPPEVEPFRSAGQQGDPDPGASTQC